MTDLQLPLDVRAIQQIIPHRYPILLVDRIVELDPGAARGWIEECFDQ